MFSSKHNIQLTNHINKLENKVDILINTKNNCRCSCNCKEHETKIYKDLLEFFENKFETMKTDILEKIPNKNKDKDTEQIVKIIKDTHQQNKEELILILSDICKKQISVCEPTITEPLLREHVTGLFTSIVTNNSKFDERLRNKIDSLDKDNKHLKETLIHNDKVLRNDLQDILISIKNDIITSINTNSLDNSIKDISLQLTNINNNVNGFYFENETIKHQLLLEDEIRGYNNDIDQMKLLLVNVKSSIEDTLYNNNYEQLKAKYLSL